MSKSLADGESRVQAELVNASVAHHGVFATAIEVNRACAASWTEAAVSAKRLCANLVELQERTTDIVAKGQQWRKERQVATAALSQHQKLVELLDAPQTLDVCLRNDLFHEALMVLDYIRNLSTSQGAHRSSKLLAEVQQQMEVALGNGLLTVVLPRLTQPVALSIVVKLISFLRRLKTPEDVLVRLFLDSKSTLIDQAMQEAETLSHTPYSFLAKVVTLYKVQVAEAVTQFLACFSADVHTDELGKWCSRRAAQFVDVLEPKLRLVGSGAEVASLIEQCASCNTATAKVGLDISCVLSDLVCERVLQLFTAQLQGATTAFRAAIQTFSWKLPMGSTATLGSSTSPTGVSSVGPTPPPASLLSFLPLAYAMNGILSAFNEIRKCTVTAVIPECCDALLAFLRIIVTELRRTQRSAPLMESHEQEAFRLYCSVFVSDFVPHVIRSAERCFAASSAVVDEVRAVVANEMSPQALGLLESNQAS